MPAATLAFDILARDKASRVFKNVGDSSDRAHRRIDKFGASLGGLTRTAGLAAAGVAGLAVVVGKGFVDAAIESEKVTKDTAAVIKSMGGASKVTAKEVAKLSTKLSLQTGIDDELIQAGQNILLTFGKIRNEVGKDNKIFDRASAAAVDLSARFDKDLNSSAIMLGKALNDPIKGITALSRAGVQFTEQQKEQIRVLVESGDMLGAQKIILGELESQVGGSAAAQATAVDKLKVVWGNFSEEVGAILLPFVEKAADWLAERLPGAMDTLKKWIDETAVPALKDLKAGFEENVLPPMETVAGFIKDTLIPRLGDIVTWITENETRFNAFKLTLLGIAGAWTAIAVASAIASAAQLLALAPVIAVIGILAGAIAATHWALNRFDEQVLTAFAHVMAWGGKVVTVFKNILLGVLLIIEGVKWLLEKIPDIPSIPGAVGGGGGIGGPLNPLNWIPRGDNGGVMPGPRGVHSLAWVAGGETLIPTHKPEFRAAANENITLNVTQLPGEGQVDAGMRALHHHKRTRLIMAGNG